MYAPYALPVPPRIVGPYEILSLIGRGGIGTVYRARHCETGALVALKLLGPTPALDPNSARRLAREFETLEELNHPNIVRVVEAGVAEGYSYLAMELVEGLDLRCYLSPDIDDEISLRRSLGIPIAPAVPVEDVFGLDAFAREPDTDGLLPPTSTPVERGPEAIRAFADFMEEPETEPSGSFPVRGKRTPEHGAEANLEPAEPTRELPAIPSSFASALNQPNRFARLQHVLVQICRGLAYVHARGLVHRDLKPSNIMVDDRRRVRIMDFGLVKSIDDAQALTLSGRVVGTYRYMSPEQAQGKPLDARTDLYSLGVILYELLSGRPPFVSQKPSDLWHEIVEREPPALLALNPGAEPLLSRIAERLLRKDPDERFQSAMEVIEALDEDEP